MFRVLFTREKDGPLEVYFCTPSLRDARLLAQTLMSDKVVHTACVKEEW